MGPAAGGRICASTVEATALRTSATEPVLRQPVRRRTHPGLRAIGAVRLPLAGPYRPWARLYLAPDGALDWRVRLFETDRVVEQHVDTETLRRFARQNGLRALAHQLEALLERAAHQRRT